MPNFTVNRMGNLGRISAGGDCPKVLSDIKTDSCYVPVYSNGLTKEGLYGYTNKSVSPENSITISARGTVGAVFFRKEAYFPIVRLISFIPDNKKIISKYLYYLLKIMPIAGFGTSQQQITIPYLSKIKIKYISDLQYQNKIASILSNYDELIEKNNRKIEILQEMAEELYKEWFVRFRFPGYKDIKKKDSTLGIIPECFKITKMSEIFENYIGGGWGNDNESNQYSVPAYVIRGTDFPSITKGKISTCPYRWHKESNYKSRQLKVNDIIIEISGGTAEQPVGRAILIDDNLIKRFDNKVICASFCKQVSLKQDKVSPIYFYYWMKFLYDTRMIDRFQLQSTGIINFKFEYFVRKGDVLLPPKPLMDKFDNIVATIRKDISLLAEQNENLIQQRDLLLPRLMSGKLEVKGGVHV